MVPVLSIVIIKAQAETTALAAIQVHHYEHFHHFTQQVQLHSENWVVIWWIFNTVALNEVIYG